MRKPSSGMNWLRQEKRLAIYLRDGMACSYCGVGVVEQEGVQFTLDHLRPVSAGGGNQARNVVMACKSCNASRGEKPLRAWLLSAQPVRFPDREVSDIMRWVRMKIARKVPLEEAKSLIQSRGGLQKVLLEVSKKERSG